MARTIIRDNHLRIIGYIEDTREGQRAFSATLRILGNYSPRDNYTRDWRGMIVGTGNLLAGLIDRSR